MDTLLQDIQVTARRLRSSPGFTAAVILTLGLGVGLNTAMFSLVHAVLLAPLPYPDADRLTFIGMSRVLQDARRPLSGPELVELAEGASLHSAIGAIWPTSGTIVDDGRPEPVRLGLVTANFFSLVGVSPARGRAFDPGDQGSGARPVIMLSWSLWQSRYGGSDVVGREVRVDGGWGFPGGAFTVAGVMPEGFEMLLPLDASVPATLDAWIPFPLDLASLPRTMFFLRGVGRVAPDAAVAAAQQELERVGGAIMAKHGYSPGRRFTAVPLAADVVKGARMPLLILQASVLVVLLIACVNLANLALVRAQTYRKDLGLRLALGASRRRLARLLLTESFVLVGLGALLGLAVAQVSLRGLPFLSLETLPRAHGATLNLPVLAFSLGATALCAVLLWFVSLGQVRRGDALVVLRSARQGRAGEPSRTWRSVLAVAELGLALVLLVTAGLLTRAFLNLHAVDTGYKPDQVLTFKLSLPVDRYGGADLSRFSRVLEERLRAVPGVASAGAINQLPLDETPNWATPYRTRQAESEPASADARLVTPGYFETVRAELVEGRWITDADDESQPFVLLVDERLARKAWPGADPLDQELLVSVATEAGFRPRWGRVVGVVRHQRHHDPAQEVREQVFIPFAQAPRNQLAAVVRSQVEPGALMRDIARQIAAVDPDLAPAQPRLLGDYVAAKQAAVRFTMLLAVLSAGFSLLLACLGVYGVISYSVAQRASELGVRAALGAGRADLLRLVLGRGAALTAAGIAIGLLASFGIARLMRNLLFEVAPFDPVTFAIAPVLVGATALLACYLPARRAAAVDPVQVLRLE